MRQAKIPEYIQVRSGIYYVRVPVPSGLRVEIGKRELKRSLNTRSSSEAAKLAPQTIAYFQRQIEAARARCTPVHIPTVTEIAIEDARSFARHRVEQMQTLPDQARSRGRHFLSGRGAERAKRLAENRDLLRFYEEVEAGGQWDSWRVALGRSTLRAYELEHRVQIEPLSIAHGVLSDLGAQAEIEHVRRAIHRDEQQHATAPAPNSSPALAIEEEGMSLKRLLAAYRSDKSATWRPASANAFVKVERLLSGWFGNEASVCRITREQWRELFNALPRIPTGYSRVKAFNGMTVTQVIEAADGMEEQPQRLSVKSCADYAVHINSLLNWAAKEDVLPKNPATGLRVPPARVSDPRRPFRHDELCQLFSLGLFATRPSIEDQDGRFWLPLIALFSGMRSGEIARLHVSDIAEVQGVMCFRLTDATVLKTAQSVRDIPIHSELIRLGLLVFVREREAAGAATLFPDVRRNGKDDQSSEFSKQFRKMMTATGLTDLNLTMHSFRHTFAHALVAIDAPQAVAEALQGWGGKKPRNMFAHYGGRPPIRQLAETVERVIYPGLDLSHLQRCSTTETTTSQGRQFD